MVIKIDKKVVYWITVFILQVLFVTWYYGLWDKNSLPIPLPTPDPPKPFLVLTANQAKLVKDAVDIIKDDLKNTDVYTSTEQIIEGLMGEIPLSTQSKVKKALGNPDFEDIEASLDKLVSNITIED